MESIEGSAGAIAAQGIVDIRTSATGGAMKGTMRKKGQGISNSIVFDEKQMMSVKVMRSTLERGQNPVRKNREHLKSQGQNALQHIN